MGIVSPLRRFFLYTFPVLVLMSIIFVMSTDRGSAEHTRTLIEKILRQWFPAQVADWPIALFERIDWNVRKVAHVTEYTLLGVLTYRMLGYGRPNFYHYQVWGTVLFCVAYAASDEYHQSFYASRGAAAGDVFFDAFGAILATMLCLWHRLVGKQQKTSP
jgi:VanZ family protein